jgi:ferredoxin
MPALVDKAKCTACEDCVESCPTEVISMVDGHAFVNAEECIDCEACIDACPEDAISMVDE